ncbi:MAG: hypothetical protein ACI4U2_03460 [Christensenellaceae bacterium]
MKDKKTIRQLVRFWFVSGVVSAIQLVLVNGLFLLMKGWDAPLPGGLARIFTEATVGEGNDNWGYILPFLLSNLIANVCGYFLNGKATFQAEAPKRNVVIYLAVVLLLILFSTWFQGVVTNALLRTGTGVWETLAPSLAASCAGMLQFLVLFPLEKYVLFRERTNEASA